MRNFVRGFIVGVGLILFLVLQIRFDVISKVIVAVEATTSVVSAVWDFVDRCDTSICCEECPKVTVTRIIDGDTFDSSAGRIRLFGVDTPERGERCFDEATERLEKLAEDTVRVQADIRKHDIYNRRLFYVYTEDGESIDELLIREGYGRAWTRDGQHRNSMMATGRQARREKTGCLWKSSFPWSR